MLTELDAMVVKDEGDARIVPVVAIGTAIMRCESAVRNAGLMEVDNSGDPGELPKWSVWVQGRTSWREKTASLCQEGGEGGAVSGICTLQELGVQSVLSGGRGSKGAVGESCRPTVYQMGQRRPAESFPAAAISPSRRAREEAVVHPRSCYASLPSSGAPEGCK